jgi:CDP-diacylglycerol--serine O-phosphatidyltransferase
MQEKLPVRKGVYILPNLFTTASLFTGFMAVIWASQGNFEWSAMGIFFSAVMDGLDGKVARLTKTTSEFGVQYDSLADLAAFGVAPGFMVYAWCLKDYGTIGTTSAFLFATCSALRLARFNVAAAAGASKKFFTGLPTPAAGCTLASLALFQPYIPGFMQGAIPPFCLVLTVFLAFLMVSRVRYYSFKEFGFITTYRFRSMLVAILLFTLVIMAPKVLGFLAFFGYIVAGFVYTFIMLPRKVHLPPPLTKIIP